jgi:hypothetical protein
VLTEYLLVVVVDFDGGFEIGLGHREWAVRGFQHRAELAGAFSTLPSEAAYPFVGRDTLYKTLKQKG